MGLPQTNARLRSINEPGASEDFDREAGAPGNPKWRGNSDAYVKDTIRTAYSQGAGRLDKIRDTRLIIPADLRYQGEELTIQSGDIVVYEWEGKQHQQSIADIDGAILPGMTSTVRLHLRPGEEQV